MTDDKTKRADAEPDAAAGDSERSVRAETGARAAPRLDTVIVDSLVTIAAIAGACAFAFRPSIAGSPAAAGFALPLALAAGLAAYRLNARDELREMLAPRFGDLTLGAGAGLLTYVGAMVTSNVLAGPSSPRVEWLARLYLHFSPIELGALLAGRADKSHHWVAAGGLVSFALLELALRGLVGRPLSLRYGPIVGTAAPAFIAAIGFAPAAILLGGGPLGVDLLPPLFAFTSALFAGLLLLRSSRILPGMIAQGLFAWALFEFPLWQPPALGLP